MSKKLELDKYYTPVELAKKCIEKTYEVVGVENISEVIEPSAGSGSFSKQLDGCRAYDIEPEGEGIEEQDYLELELGYKKGRLIIGNPPFGTRLYKARDFYRKSVELGDYIAFILPIGQLNNVGTLYEFDLVHSEDLGVVEYSGREIHCCFNIYKRNELGLNKKPKAKLKDITIVRQDSKRYEEMEDYDLRMCYWGNSSAGKVLNEGESYSAEYKIKVNKVDKRERVVEVLKGVDWKEELRCVAMLKINQQDIVAILRREIPGIE